MKKPTLRASPSRISDEVRVAAHEWGGHTITSGKTESHCQSAMVSSTSGVDAEPTPRNKKPTKETWMILNADNGDFDGFFHPLGGPRRFCTVKWRKPPRRSETIEKYRQAVEDNNLLRLEIPVVATEPLAKDLLQFYLNKGADGTAKETRGKTVEPNNLVKASPARAENNRIFETFSAKNDNARPDGLTSGN
ncbi:hypothetical protein BIW11_10345 [Tropilaelaps mercedesae]|uniref:Uncharacterized protein n=1 Tax=Tropilaelaps mercedesae TaxID=418985 RepID=A0A1V9XG18_9ACAR|nr:hypothetical protein BIW11_10345 [Tropilaelaps mercedesae]